MLECINCDEMYDGENVPFCPGYEDNETKCVDVRMCESCEEYEAERGEDYCERCQREAEQEYRDREWDYWHA